MNGRELLIVKTIHNTGDISHFSYITTRGCARGNCYISSFCGYNNFNTPHTAQLVLSCLEVGVVKLATLNAHSRLRVTNQCLPRKWRWSHSCLATRSESSLHNEPIKLWKGRTLISSGCTTNCSSSLLGAWSLRSPVTGT